MPVRIYDISKKLGLEIKEVLAKAKELGLTGARAGSSSLDKITAEYLEMHLRSDHPEIGVALTPTPPPWPPPTPAPIVGEKVGFIQLPTKPTAPKPQKPPTPKLVRISEVAQKVGLPLDQVRLIAKEFNIPLGPSPDSLTESDAQSLAQIIQSGGVQEKRLKVMPFGKS